MTERTPSTESITSSDFARQAEKARTGVVGEYLQFLKSEKKWWLAPILFSLLLAAAFVILGGTAAAPLIYALF